MAVNPEVYRTALEPEIDRSFFTHCLDSVIEVPSSL